ncbi:MAG: class I SAM-dependent methyltransferase [Ardenticatenaceae bacterium]
MNSDTMKAVRELLEGGEQAKIPYEEINARFEGVNASIYGEGMVKWCPDYHYAHDLLLRSIKPTLPASAKILDLGAGTGRVSKLLLEAFETCHVTLLDLSPNMLKEAPNKLRDFAGRYTIVQGDFFNQEVDFPAQSFDAVVSVFSICHGRKQKNYQDLYKKIYKSLKPGTRFVCIDYVYSPTIDLSELAFHDWGDFMTPHFPPESVYEALTSTITEDSPLTLQTHMQLLLDAGFSAVDVLWRKSIFGMYMGIKQA